MEQTFNKKKSKLFLSNNKLTLPYLNYLTFKWNPQSKIERSFLVSTNNRKGAQKLLKQTCG